MRLVSNKILLLLLFFTFLFFRSPVIGIRQATTALPLDGFNIWRSLSEGAASPRTKILHNIDLTGIAIRDGDMKLLMNVANHSWYRPPELFPGIRMEKVNKVDSFFSYIVQFLFVCLFVCFVVFSVLFFFLLGRGRGIFWIGMLRIDCIGVLFVPIIIFSVLGMYGIVLRGQKLRSREQNK